MSSPEEKSLQQEVRDLVEARLAPLRAEREQLRARLAQVESDLEYAERLAASIVEPQLAPPRPPAAVEPEPGTAVRSRPEGGPAGEGEKAPPAPEPAGPSKQQFQPKTPEERAARDAERRRAVLGAYESLAAERPGEFVPLSEVVERSGVPQSYASLSVRELAAGGAIEHNGRGGAQSRYRLAGQEHEERTRVLLDVGEQQEPASRATPAGALTDEQARALVPEHLRGMPAAASISASGRTAGQMQPQIQAAQNQHDVLRSVARMPGTPGEVAARLKLKPASVGRYMRDLGAAGLVRLTGEQREGGAEYAQGDGTPITEEPEGALALMPAATSGKGRGHLVTTVAMQQLRVAQEAIAHGRPFVIGEFAERLPWPRTRTQEYLNALAEAGVGVRRTGVMRRAAGVDAGRTAVEYVGAPRQDVPELAGDEPSGPAEGPADAQEAAEPAPAPAAPRQVVHLGRRDRVTVANVRDLVLANRGKAHTKFSLANALGIENVKEDDRGLVAALDALKEMGTIADSAETIGGHEVHVYRWQAPVSSGGSRPRQPTPEQEAVGAGPNGRGAPVAGTGGGVKVTDPDVRALVRAAQAAGATVAMAPSGHFDVKIPGGHPSRVQIAATPSSRRTVLNDRARLRRAGLALS